MQQHSSCIEAACLGLQPPEHAPYLAAQHIAVTVARTGNTHIPMDNGSRELAAGIVGLCGEQGIVFKPYLPEDDMTPQQQQRCMLTISRQHHHQFIALGRRYIDRAVECVRFDTRGLEHGVTRESLQHHSSLG